MGISKSVRIYLICAIEDYYVLKIFFGLFGLNLPRQSGLRSPNLSNKDSTLVIEGLKEHHGISTQCN